MDNYELPLASVSRIIKSAVPDNIQVPADPDVQITSIRDMLCL